ncbi:5404_t:CDS:1, partial [Gigaspora margarita]
MLIIESSSSQQLEVTYTSTKCKVKKCKGDRSEIPIWDDYSSSLRF